MSQALIAAATALFAEHGPSAVSVRDIAAAAGVNHGLVHRHFGSKTRLLAAVMERLRDGVEDALGPPCEGETLDALIPRVFGATRSQNAYWRILARAMLEGIDPRRLQSGFPVVTRLVAAARRSGLGGDAQLVIAMCVAAGLGVLMFEPFLVASTGVAPRRLRGWENGLPLAIARLVGVS